MDRSDWPPQPAGHIELWLTMANLKDLLRRRFRLLHQSTIVPMGNRGVLRIINSPSINAAFGRVISQQYLERFKEWAGLGWTLMAVGEKR
jgi:hypothetical protein